MADALEIAIRAEEAAKSAHHRLDRMNGSIERAGDAINALRVDLADARREAAQQTQTILRRLDHDDGVESGELTASRGLIDSRRFLITTIVVVLTSSLTAFLLTLALRGH